MSKPIKFGFVGFRHGHILTLVELCRKHRDIEICASCEENAETREQVKSQGVDITHESFEAFLQSSDCDVVAVGDAFGLRGQRVIGALKAGKHVISDKPICTSLDELDAIERLSAQSGLKVGCMLTRRDLPSTIASRNIIREGTLGRIHAIHFNGQHPLLPQSRPHWYFEPGLHGGTINDIAVHAMDFIPWVTGLDFSLVNAARCWNAFARDYPHFEDGGQLMLTMENGAGVLGDVSYFTPDGMAYNSPYYWETTYFGEGGVLEVSQNCQSISLLLREDEKVTELPLPEPPEGTYFDQFLADLAGQPQPDDLDTPTVLKVSRQTLLVQKAADENIHDLALS